MHRLPRDHSVDIIILIAVITCNSVMEFWWLFTVMFDLKGNEIINKGLKWYFNDIDNYWVIRGRLSDAASEGNNTNLWIEKSFIFQWYWDNNTLFWKLFSRRWHCDKASTIYNCKNIFNFPFTILEFCCEKWTYEAKMNPKKDRNTYKAINKEICSPR